MANIDINKLARMITEDPDVFLENEGYQGHIGDQEPQVLFDMLLKTEDRLLGIRNGSGPDAKVFGHQDGPRDRMILWFTPQNSKILNLIYQDWHVLSTGILDFIISQKENIKTYNWQEFIRFAKQNISGIMTIVDDGGDPGNSDPRFLPSPPTPRNKGIRISLSEFEEVRESLYFAMRSAKNAQRLGRNDDDTLSEGYPMATDKLVRGNPTDPLVKARQAVNDYGIKIRHAERLDDKAAADYYRNELRKILDDLKYQWQNDPHASELLEE